MNNSNHSTSKFDEKSIVKLNKIILDSKSSDYKIVFKALYILLRYDCWVSDKIKDAVKEISSKQWREDYAIFFNEFLNSNNIKCKLNADFKLSSAKEQSNFDLNFFYDLGLNNLLEKAEIERNRLKEEVNKSNRENEKQKNANEWKCNKCGEILEIQFNTCWNCGEENNLLEEAEIERNRLKEELNKSNKEKKKINWKKEWEEFKIDESFLKKTPIKNKYTAAILYYLIAFLLFNILVLLSFKVVWVLAKITGSALAIIAGAVVIIVPVFGLYFTSIYRLFYFMIKRKKKKPQKIIIKNETAVADITDATETIKKEEFNEPVMTSDEALTELKKSKEKLDLELITQEEYNKVKEELKQYIS